MFFVRIIPLYKNLMTISSFEQMLELDWAWGKKIIIFRITHNYLKVILLVKLSLLYMKSLGASN